jgi:hypothetical protein
MPAKSKKQLKFMQAVANNPKFAKKVGVPQSVGKEFTKVKKYEKGGMTEEDKKMFGEKETDLPPPEGFEKSDDKETKRTKTVKPAPKKGNPAAVMKKKGGKIGMGMTKNNYKKGGSVKCKRDGICVRGKTKGRMI